MRLKAPLCKVETDDANFFHGCPLHSWDAQTSPPWHIAMPSGGGIHSIKRIDQTNVAARCREGAKPTPSKGQAPEAKASATPN